MVDLAEERMQTTLNASLALAAVSAAVFALVGIAVRRRAVSSDLQAPRDAFALWWHCIAAFTAMQALLAVPAYFEPGDVHLYVSLQIVAFLALCLGLGSLLYYLLRIFTGNRHVLLPLVAYYVFCYGFLVYVILLSEPQRVLLGRWGPELDPMLPPGPLLYTLLAVLLVPPIVGALAYLSLYFRVHDSGQRRRILLVGGSIVAWFVMALLGQAGSGGGIMLPLSRLVGLGAGVATLHAFRKGLAPDTVQAPPATATARGTLAPRRMRR